MMMMWDQKKFKLTDIKPERARQDSPTNREMPWCIIRLPLPHAQLERRHQRTSATFAIPLPFVKEGPVIIRRCCSRR